MAKNAGRYIVVMVMIEKIKIALHHSAVWFKGIVNGFVKKISSHHLVFSAFLIIVAYLYAQNQIVKAAVTNQVYSILLDSMTTLIGAVGTLLALTMAAFAFLFPKLNDSHVKFHFEKNSLFDDIDSMSKTFIAAGIALTFSILLLYLQ